MSSRSAFIAISLAVIGFSVLATAQQWRPVGPDGGTVRSLAYDPGNPDHILLGTSAGQLYGSQDKGVTWARLAHLGKAAELVLDEIVFEPRHPSTILVAGWDVSSAGGELFRSRDSGKTWTALKQMHGKSIRALAISASDSAIVIAGALDGVYRSSDEGDTWQRISPANSTEIRDVESVAIDPDNSQIIYAGTWHLPWKTLDGGRSWHNIKKGVIEDSDVFSITIDSSNPARIFMSACSGIYRSESAGELFRKIQGIPYSARRTRVLTMDPKNHNVVFAGTTEGLWKTIDGGATWKRMTSPGVIVNDVLVDPRQPSWVLLATEYGGVLASEDGGATFIASNTGFTHRQISTVLVNPHDNSDLYVGLLNDKEYGGVFHSRDGGLRWRQMSDGMAGRDVFVLRQERDGSLLAGTDEGVWEKRKGSGTWEPRNNIAGEPAAVPPTKTASRKHEAPQSLNVRVNDIQLLGSRWLAGTSAGLFVSADQGATWSKVPLRGISSVVSLGVNDGLIVAASHLGVAVSVNGGESWLPVKFPVAAGLINSVYVDRTGSIWLAAHEGVFKSTDAGDSWRPVNTLPLSDVLALRPDAENHRLLAVGALSTNVFESFDGGRTWRPFDSGWVLHDLAAMNGHLVAATAFDGLVVQPAPTGQTAVASGKP